MNKKTYAFALCALLFSGCEKKEEESPVEELPLVNIESSTLVAIFGGHLGENLLEVNAKMAEIDLNKDGVSENIILLQNKERCSNRGCSYAFFRRNENRWEMFQGIIAHEIELSKLWKSQEYSALIVNKNRLWQWNGAKYEYKGQIEIEEEK